MNDLTPLENPENHNEQEISMDTNKVNNEPESTIEEAYKTALENTTLQSKENNASNIKRLHQTETASDPAPLPPCKK